MLALTWLEEEGSGFFLMETVLMKQNQPAPIKYAKPPAVTSAMQTLTRSRNTQSTPGQISFEFIQDKGRFPRFQISGVCSTDIL